MSAPNEAAVIPSKGLLNLTREQYDAIKGRENWSRLKLIGGEDGSPALYRHILDNPPGPDSDAMARGRVVHLATYQPHLLEEVAVWEGKRQGKEWEAFETDHKAAGHEVVTRKIYDEAIAIGKAVRSSAMAKPYLSGGRGEATLLWRLDFPAAGDLPAYGFNCKGMLDFVADVGVIADLKSCQKAHSKGFGKAVANYEYLGQAAFYVDGYEIAMGKRLPYVFIAVEAKAPHVVQVHTVSDEQLEHGRDIYRARLDLLHHCRTNNDWFGYSTTPVPLELPKWAVPFDDDDADDLGLVIGG